MKSSQNSLKRKLTTNFLQKTPPSILHTTSKHDVSCQVIKSCLKFNKCVTKYLLINFNQETLDDEFVELLSHVCMFDYL